ncbi:MAG: acetate--CoA ligase family protein [Acidobacteriota bacterium]|nr:acetate--CoA ligase family protein [Acidobacteriota bacterium]
MNEQFKRINQIFEKAEKDNRTFLLEHEVYQMLEVMDIPVPRFRFLKRGEAIEAKDLDRFPSDTLVLKIVSPSIFHKSDVGGVRFVPKDLHKINETCRKMEKEVPDIYMDWIKARSPSSHLGRNEDSQYMNIEDIHGILICEAVAYEREGLGSELLIGLRSSREFGTVLTVGLGGKDVEYLNERIKEGQAVAVGSVHLLQRENILPLIKPLAFFDKLAYEHRGQKAILSQEHLVDICFQFLQVGAHFSSLNLRNNYVIEEAEVNPFVIRQKKLVALDGLCRFSKSHLKVKTRPFEDIKYILHPKKIGIIGVSERMNLGHIILNNMLRRGFPKENVYIVKPGIEEIEGCACVPSISDLPEAVDLFVLTLAADQSYDVMRELMTHEKARSVIIISGGLGEKQGTEHLEESIKKLLEKGREQGKLTPVVNGGNCLGIFSMPGKYDTTFIPDYKLYKLPRSNVKKTGLVYLSQSGAFMISRMSNLPSIEPLYAVSIGNQIDITIADYLKYLKNDDHAKFFAIYLEGFLSGDGLAFAQAANEIAAQEGKTVIVYKAGRTPEGQAATASHTASIAGDYRLAYSILKQAGVVIADSLSEFENFIKAFCYFQGKKVRGNRIALVSNAGFECVIMSDNLKNDEELMLPEFSPSTEKRLKEILSPLGIERLQDIHNPLDTTPVADDETFCRVVEVILEDQNIDCAVVSPLPMTPSMQTLPASEYHRENLSQKESLAFRLVEVFKKTDKPFVVNVDSGEIYQPLVDVLENEGVPTFRRCDEAVRFLRKYINAVLKS